MFAVLDEIWKAGPVTTSLFKITNERVFRNGAQTINCPLITALAASNEYPSNKMDAPLWDRLLFRFKVEAVWDPEGVKQIQAAKRVVWDPEKLTLAEIHAAKKAVWAVDLPKDVEEALIAVHVVLYKTGIELSGRRRDKMYSVVRANAWLNGNDVATMDDISAIWPCCWENDSQIKAVRKIIAKVSNYELDKMMTQLDVAAALYADAKKLVNAYNDSERNPDRLGNIDELEIKLDEVKQDLLNHRARYSVSNQAECDNIVAHVSAWHRELLPYATIKAEQV